MTSTQPKLFPSAANGLESGGGVVASGSRVAEAMSSDASGSSVGDDAEKLLADLRAQFDDLSSSFAKSMEERAASVSRGVKSGVANVVDEIKAEPLLAIALATTLGVIVGIVVTQRASREPTWQETANHYQTQAKNELESLLSKARAASYDTQKTAAGFMPAVERWAHGLSQMDLGTTVGSSVDKAASVARSLWNSMSSRSPT
jgi:ElaB/YqjD/DUF883 family membrane-anchored ribosome-binding protein